MPQSPFSAAYFPASGAGGGPGSHGHVPKSPRGEPALAHEVSFAGSYPTGPHAAGEKLSEHLHLCFVGFFNCLPLNGAAAC